MQVVASGVFHDATTARPSERSASSTAVHVTAAGEVLVTCRLGTDREGNDGHSVVFASTDLGATWDRRYSDEGDTTFDGHAGETRSFLIAELVPGELTASILWTDRSDPTRPWVNPVTQGLLPMRNFHARSVDGGRTWSAREPIDLSPYPGASTTGPLLRLSSGTIGQPFEHWKEYDDPAIGVPTAMLKLDHGTGYTVPRFATVARDPANEIYFWDQRLALHPVTNAAVAMFWTHERRAARDRPIHIAWSLPGGHYWSTPVPTGLPGQHCQPVSIGGDGLLAVYSHRRSPPGIRAAISDDFGRTWDRSREIEVWSSRAGDEPGTVTDRSAAEYWNDMGAWQFGHPRGALLPNGEVIVVWYGGAGSERSGRWARLRL